MSRIFLLHARRINLISIIFLLFGIAILTKVFYIQTFNFSKYKRDVIAKGITKKTMKGFRGSIFDRNGNPLAEVIKTYTFWANTNNKVDKEKIYTLFSKTFNQPKKFYESLLLKNKDYIELAHGKLISQSEPVLEQIKNIKGLYCDINISRYYPYNNLVSQVVGYVDRDYLGQFGIERQFDSLLKGKTGTITYNVSANGRLREAVLKQNNNPKNGSDIELTLDIDKQIILLSALKKGLDRSGAKSANGIILDPYTGDILAMASVPDFNPNEYWNFNVSNFANRTISEAYEPGSTYKVVPIVAALELKKFSKNDLFFCENGKYKIIPSKTIHDHEPHGNLTLSEIFIYSSNIGLSKMVDKLGAHHIYDYSRKFGFGVRTGIPLPSETPGMLRQFEGWTRLSGPSVSMGQEIAINSLQLALAYCAVANGGFLPKVRLIKKIYGPEYEKRDYSPQTLRKVMSPQTSNMLLSMMEDVVNRGTGYNAKIPGFKIGGKTGTAEKFINGSYSKHQFISSFVSIFPTNKPKYVCVISVDSPDYKRGKHWGNETAAPIVKDIFERLIIQDEDIITNTANHDYKQIIVNSLGPM